MSTLAPPDNEWLNSDFGAVCNCGQGAMWLVTCKSCGHRYLLCEPHMRAMEDRAASEWPTDSIQQWDESDKWQCQKCEATYQTLNEAATWIPFG